jgi:rhodanese-related sulfurtransferase
VKTALWVLLLLAGARHAPCQVLGSIDAPDPVVQQTAGSKLKYFSAVDDGVYKGSRPKSDADYRFLQSLHVRYIVDLQVLPLMSLPEKRKAKEYGITVITGTMNASPISPSEKHVTKILAILGNERYHPVYFHCKLGRDRTAIIAALYKIYFLGMPPQEAKQYLRQAGYGFKYGWLRSGLTRYLKNHPSRRPDLLLDTAAISVPQPSAAQF